MNERLRDTLLFVGGFAGMVYETAIAEQVSVILVGAFLATMLGAPVVYRLLDRWERK